MQLIEASRLWVGLWFVYGLFGLVIARLVLAQQIRRWQAQGRLAIGWYLGVLQVRASYSSYDRGEDS